MGAHGVGGGRNGGIGRRTAEQKWQQVIDSKISATWCELPDPASYGPSEGTEKGLAPHPARTNGPARSPLRAPMDRSSPVFSFHFSIFSFLFFLLFFCFFHYYFPFFIHILKLFKFEFHSDFEFLQILNYLILNLFGYQICSYFKFIQFFVSFLFSFFVTCI